MSVKLPPQGMDDRRHHELCELAMVESNATLHALMKLWQRGEMPFDEWAHYAIVHLSKENTLLRKLAVEATMSQRTVYLKDAK